jgi:hypothetical protein
VSARRHAAALGACLALCGAGAARAAGPYTEPGHAPGVVESWATSVVSFDRGPLDIANPGGGDASFGAPEYVLGTATNDVYDVFSLGDGGSITLFFAGGIANAAGDDFAVFENGFYAPGGLYGELAFVEVSSNGVDFARFPATSLRESPVAGGETIDPSEYHNLAGKHPLNRGTGFDLAVLAQHPLIGQGKLDLANVAYVRLVDVIGNGSTLDAAGRPVYDPYSTPFPSGGFDADAVGAPEPDATAALAAGALAICALARRRRSCARSR